MRLALSRLLRHEHHPAIGKTEEDWELRQFDIQAEQRYRTMTGLEEPLERRAERARRHAAKIQPLSHKTW